MLLYVYAFDLLSISTSHTAVVPVRSFSMRALKIFKSCSASALPAATGTAPAAVFAAEGAEFFDIVYSTAPTATAATTTKIPTAILLVLDCFCPCAASNIFPSFSPPTSRVRGPASPRTRERQRRRSCAGCARRQKHSPANGGTSWNSGMKGREAPRPTLIAHPASLHKRQLARGPLAGSCGAWTSQEPLPNRTRPPHFALYQYGIVALICPQSPHGRSPHEPAAHENGTTPWQPLPRSGSRPGQMARGHRKNRGGNRAGPRSQRAGRPAQHEDVSERGQPVGADQSAL